MKLALVNWLHTAFGPAPRVHLNIGLFSKSVLFTPQILWVRLMIATLQWGSSLTSSCTWPKCWLYQQWFYCSPALHCSLTPSSSTSGRVTTLLTGTVPVTTAVNTLGSSSVLPISVPLYIIFRLLLFKHRCMKLEGRFGPAPNVWVFFFLFIRKVDDLTGTTYYHHIKDRFCNFQV